ncbi:MAG: hypothetical protein KGN02_03825 [bacterium]|nr:hypothetical protein [bacterium]
MKLPYRVGDSCGLPLGDGAIARARIVAHQHHLVDVAIEDARGRDVLVLRTTDRALVLQRWRRIGRGEPHADERVPRHARIVGPAHAERLAARALAGETVDEPPRVVRMLQPHDDVAAVLAVLPGDAMLALGEPLAAHARAALHAWFAAHPLASLRLHGEAASAHLAEATTWGVTRLVLAGDASLAHLHAPHVRALDVQVPCDAAEIARAFPLLESLRIGALRAEVDIAALAPLERLRLLDLSHVALHRSDALVRLERLRALRIAHVTAPPAAATVAALALERLAIEAQGTLDDLRALARCTSLRELALRELWQFAIEDVTFVHDMRALVRVEIDIGGRRKNVELYRRADWAYPRPFDWCG